ncbi:hypothetical protein G6F22_020883 [Rhizopus arrhizus]|nr:hypothetical protein G6F22_020883 [Rhizopus arrhizus]
MHLDTLTPAKPLRVSAAHDPLEQPAHEPMPHQFLSNPVPQRAHYGQGMAPLNWRPCLASEHPDIEFAVPGSECSRPMSCSQRASPLARPYRPEKDMGG